MATLRNPKLQGTNIFDCIPQAGKCPNNCNQCFFNRPDAFFTNINEPHVPSVDEVGDDGIVRVNSGHDSNIQKQLVLQTTECFKRKFFNTSIPDFDFPAPVVFTANRNEESPPYTPNQLRGQFKYFDRLMFVRLKASPTNFQMVRDGVERWNDMHIPVVITFMRYYDCEPLIKTDIWDNDHEAVLTLEEFAAQFGESPYLFKKHISNTYWCPSPMFIRMYMRGLGAYYRKLLFTCGSFTSSFCKDCMNCVGFYHIAVNRMEMHKTDPNYHRVLPSICPRPRKRICKS